MKISIYNTLVKKIQELKPRIKGRLEIFVCGPTVYDAAHIGHARSYIVYDAFVKFLRRAGFKVFYLQNITDVDDKIINRAKKEGDPWKKISTKFEKEYLEDMKAIGVNSVSQYARATNHIPEIIKQVKGLLKKGLGYKIQEDGIYFDISKFKNYGQLSNRTAEQAEDAVSRIDKSIRKRNKGDFCLWKFSKPGEPKWASPWRPGRPGWHIEDTAITEKFFGPQYGLHGGGQDLIFPHHEAEIAQMESLSGKSPLAKYWMHTGMLTIKGKKMSKSLKNYVTIKDFLKEHPKELLRFLVLKAHWHSPLDYDENKVKEAKAGLEKIKDFLIRISEISALPATYTPNYTLNPILTKRTAVRFVRMAKERFFKALSNNFNTPKAIAVVFDFIKEANALFHDRELRAAEAKIAINFLKEVNKILGIIDFSIIERPKAIPQDIQQMIILREQLRSKGDFEKADQIRQAIFEKGFIIEDTNEGPRVKPKTSKINGASKYFKTKHRAP